ncbi:MAG: hypothetical protein ABIH25_02760 [Candidatus Woesearchaeota archaeon]
MKSIIFDTSTIISIATNNLLWITERLKNQFKGEFIIPKSVEAELVDNPLKTKKFKLAAIIIKDYIDEGVFKLYSSPAIRQTAQKILTLANTIFIKNNNTIKIISIGEAEALALAVHLKSDALAIDERTLRLLVEDPDKLHNILERKMHTKIIINKENLNEFKALAGNIKILRSTELLTITYDLGLLDKYISAKKVMHKHLRKPLLEGALWGLKLRGASISEQEINEILNARFG